ncbi:MULTISPECIES: ankyrin repeat domain-containing protein [unclassified Wolbachia]|uniref:ankyrin repeat domain-containing protein n=1 Tax=unclassified Wolbachia TaxID=2640676 RepID=UPI001106967B|nr:MULTISPECIES: ankyrin repeat domain-containing protein [unclassified Wolbachia]QVU17301.1 Ankyrin repeat domain protein [Wolbachia endosymbiont of Drosophila santomea]QWE32405.1 Ankyrin repeat domain protein [Wolbachia endosymbiont of Drosophila simulans]QVU16099.1 Ankyrin repeat domain protein [Wolbachia endosymbiont of Drosophila yakuba]TLW85649.1 ankyrin repeat domain-containing protein [Wolbachia endosymbiont of Drosophila teissieri]TLW86245.1 ankyrin repeat domain-containing protein [W
MNRNVRRLFRNDGLILLIVLVVCIVVICSSLFDKGDKNHNTELEIATKNCDLEAVKSLMKSDVNIGEKALRYSAGNGCLEVIKFLVEGGVDINAANKFKWTALHSATDKGHLEIVEFLLEQGANPNVKDNDGKSPRKIAVMESRHNKDKSYREIIKLLAQAEDQHRSKK